MVCVEDMTILVSSFTEERHICVYIQMKHNHYPIQGRVEKPHVCELKIKHSVPHNSKNKNKKESSRVDNQK